MKKYNALQTNKSILTAIFIVIFVFSFSWTRAEEVLPLDAGDSGDKAEILDAPENEEVNTNTEKNEAESLPEGNNSEPDPDSVHDELNSAPDEPIIDTEAGDGESAEVTDLSGEGEDLSGAETENSRETSAGGGWTTLKIEHPEEALAGETNNQTGEEIQDTDSTSGGGQSFGTGIIRHLDIAGLTIIAQWQMNTENSDNLSGSDDSAEAGAQFLPSGQYEVDKKITVCALIVDPAGPGNIGSSRADVYYPDGIKAGEDLNGATRGCGRLMAESTLEKIGNEEAADLICGRLRENNNNLPSWSENAGTGLAYGYEHVCGREGYLASGAAALYCGEIALSYDDPAGAYKTVITAHTDSGGEALAENEFYYLELTTFQSDFSDIQYGPVKPSEIKMLSGGPVWGDLPTIRNTGNTALRISIRQNDFGMGKTNGAWNIVYYARVGQDGKLTEYRPDITAHFDRIFALGEAVRIDFGVLIRKFPETDGKTIYSGNMVISADKAPFDYCE